MNRGPWSPEETAVLIEMTNRGCTAAQIAVEINRSRKSVSERKHRLGLSVAASRPWTRAEEDRLVEMIAAGKSKKRDRRGAGAHARRLRTKKAGHEPARLRLLDRGRGRQAGGAGGGRKKQAGDRRNHGPQRKRDTAALQYARHQKAPHGTRQTQGAGRTGRAEGHALLAL